MTGSNESLGFKYRSSLDQYLRDRDEVSLNAAYDLGRRALGDGLGVLELIGVHAAALEEIVLPAGAPERPRLAKSATEFFRELLSPFEMTFRGYRDANRELSRLNQTLAEQKDALESINRELETFSYSVAHDLRAPLRSIDGFSRALLEDHAERLKDDGRHYLDRVRSSAQHMGRLIDGLLALARVARGELRRTRIDLSAAARAIVERIGATDGQRRVEVVIQDSMVVYADARLVDVVLENLLGNAWKFTRHRPCAHVELGQHDQEGRRVYFVKDNGAGFDMGHASMLFGVFQRLHSASEFEGTGIGLATVQRVIHRHGGQIWAEGHVDQGATFWFTLGGDATIR